MTERAYRNLFFHGPFAASALFAAGGWLWAWLTLRGIRTPLILHFSDYTGISQIGGLAEVHGLGATGVVIVGLNFAVALQLRAHAPRWAWILAGATLFLAALLFTALAAIISVNQ
jgi:hypothetical protein